MLRPTKVRSAKASDMGSVSVASCFGLIAANAHGLAPADRWIYEFKNCQVGGLNFHSSSRPTGRALAPSRMLPAGILTNRAKFRRESCLCVLWKEIVVGISLVEILARGSCLQVTSTACCRAPFEFNKSSGLSEVNYVGRAKPRKSMAASRLLAAGNFPSFI